MLPPIFMGNAKAQALQALDYKRITDYFCKTEIKFYFANHD